VIVAIPKNQAHCPPGLVKRNCVPPGQQKKGEKAGGPPGNKKKGYETAIDVPPFGTGLREEESGRVCLTVVAPFFIFRMQEARVPPWCSCWVLIGGEGRALPVGSGPMAPG
jgi:hypothetical protein